MKKSLVILFVCLMSATTMVGQSQFVMNNSADGESTLSIFLPESGKATGRAVLCCPGGGYAHVCMDYEGTDWAPYFNEMGIAYAVLKYRMPHGDRTIPMGDAEHAIATLRDSAAVWHINPADIGIMGFSAGGHLASTIATHAEEAVRPNFQILFYPVISIDQSLGHKGSSVNFLGNEVENAELIAEYSNMNKIDERTPPAIIFMAQDDRVVPPLTNGMPYFAELSKHKIPASLHCYPRGGHGWKGERFPFFAEMQTSLANWLKQLKSN